MQKAAIMRLFLMLKIYIIFKATHASSYSISDHAANDVFEPVNDAVPFGTWNMKQACAFYSNTQVL